MYMLVCGFWQGLLAVNAPNVTPTPRSCVDINLGISVHVTENHMHMHSFVPCAALHTCSMHGAEQTT
jgi:hypothetical protein